MSVSSSTTRLLVGLFIGYPLALFYSVFLHTRKPTIKHCYFTLCGLAITYYMYGIDFVHCLINILIEFAVLKICGGTAVSVALAFLIHMTYLLYAYYNKSKDTYDVTWTLVQCMLTLRLIAVSYDCYDGKQDEDKIANFQKESRLPRIPTLLELLGHSYYFGGVLVGPQISMKRYLSFVSGELINPKDDVLSEKMKYGFHRILAGTIYLILYQQFFPKFHYKLILTPEFQNQSVLYWLWFMFWASKFSVMKYNGIWLVSEGTCIATGISYNPSAMRPSYERWNSVVNCRPWPFETGHTLQSLIRNFHITTNNWMVKYVYKRLRFLRSGILSHFGSLVFISLWHGFYAGYYLNFAWEFMTVLLEKQAANVFCTLYGRHYSQSHPLLKLALFPFAYFMRHMILAFGMMVFTLLRLDLCLEAYKVFGYANFYGVIYWIIFYTTFQIFKTLFMRPGVKSSKTVKNE